MFPKLLDQIGYWNPQLFRELKGRLIPRNVFGAIALSIGLQALLLWFFYSQLSDDPNPYCATLGASSIPSLRYTQCQVDAGGHLIIHWNQWWRDIQKALSWIVFFSLNLGGAYLLVNDIYQEEKQGTLNFIRLSPQSGHSILWGKMLGVPILVYLFAATLVPLHAIAILKAGMPATFLLSYYTLLIAGCFFLFSAALLSGLWSKAQTSATAKSDLVGNPALFVGALILIGFIPLYLIWNIRSNSLFAYALVGLDPASTTGVPWFAILLGDRHLLFSHLFTLVNLAIGSYWIWQALHRRYHNPNTALLSKTQSYGITLYSTILTLGFFWTPSHLRLYSAFEEYFVTRVFFLSIFVVIGVFLLTILLLPQRQTLLDWSRFRHIQKLEALETAAPHRRLKRGLISDLLTSEKSPIVMTMIINLGIVAIAFLSWSLSQDYHFNILSPLLMFLMTLNMLVIYGAIAQWLSFAQHKHQNFWIVLTFCLLGILPFVIAIVSKIAREYVLSQLALMISPLPTMLLILTSMSFPPLATLGLVILGQWTAAIMIIGQFNRQLRKAGESSSKELLMSSGTFS